MTGYHIKTFLFTAFAVIIWISASSWGFTAHRTINQLAVYQLPDNMRGFFYSNLDYIVRHSVRADLRRGEDSSEDKKHFINFEAFGDSAAWKMPKSWSDAVRLHSADLLVTSGYLPYHIVTMQHRLAGAFKSRNKDSILFYAADIAHYISDAHVPLHTTANYDGQLTGQNGLHNLWETMVPELDLDHFNLSSRHNARYLKRPDNEIWNALRESHSLLNDMLLQEKETSKSFSNATKYRVQIRRGKEVKTYTSEFAKAYHKRLGHTVNRQVLNSSKLVADFWYTCWVDAGKPDLSMCNLSEAQKRQLQKECKAFHKNKLLDENFLIARKRDSINQPRPQ